MEVMTALFMLVLYITVTIAIFLVIRALWLWYFRINEIVDVLQEAVNCLKSIETSLLKERSQASAIAKPVFTDSMTYAPSVAPSSSSSPMSNTPFYPGKPLRNETSEFRSIQWETTLNDVPYVLNQISSTSINGHKLDVYSNPSESLNWQELALDSVNYGFVDGLFQWGTIKTSFQDGHLVMEKLLALYGQSDMHNEGISYWLGRNTIIAFNALFGYKGQVATILYMSKRAYTNNNLGIINSAFKEK